MKKLLLFAFIMLMGFYSVAQIATPPKPLLNKAVETVYTPPVKDVTNFNWPVNQTVRSFAVAPNETVIGRSQYDLWSNTMIGNRIYMHPDGTMGAVWTQGNTPTAFPDRGTGYNFYDGNNWGPEPTERIENTRTGWPSYCSWGPNGEIVVSHNGSTGLEILTRENRGTGTWTQELYQGPAGIENDPTWPRVITSGENNEYIHMIYNSYNPYEGQESALLYSRSMDGGATWDPQDVVPDGTGSDYYYEIGADQYVMAARGSTVAILSASAWHDLFVLKSTDNGDTWEKTVIWEHPYPFFWFETTITDTLFAVDNSANLAIGPDGKVHVVFGINRVLNDDLTTTYSLFPYVDGIGYWNEDMPTFSNDLSALAPPQYGYPTSEMVEDVNYIGYMQDVNGNGTLDLVDDILFYNQLGPSTMPSIAVNNNNEVFVVYASTTETYDNFDFNFKKIWARAWVPGGGWGPFYHVTENIIHIFDESIYPTLVQNQVGEMHFIYQADATPGVAVGTNPDHDFQENRIIHAALPTSDVLTGIVDPEMITSQSVSQNYPNPFSGVTTLTVNLENAANLSLEVTNLLGQVVFRTERGDVNAGTHYFQVDASNYNKGIYFYTVKAGNSSVTKKMIVQ